MTFVRGPLERKETPRRSSTKDGGEEKKHFLVGEESGGRKLIF